jgi:hypothetical protein
MATVAKTKSTKPAATPAKTPAKKPVARTAAKTRGAASAPPRFDAPSDFKPFFAEVEFSTGTDGLIAAGSVEVSRVRGKWDNTEAPRYKMSEYDQATLVAVACRLSSVTFASNILKRLPGETRFKLIVRVSRRAADNSLASTIREAAMSNAAGKLRWFKEKADPTYRRLRRANRILPSAFVCVQLPPIKRRKAAAETEE